VSLGSFELFAHYLLACLSCLLCLRACSPELLSTTAQGVVECIIYRDPGIHPGDVRRVRCVCVCRG
jgi:hypothetical protein